MNFLRKIFSSRILPSWIILACDIALTVFSVIIGFLLRFSPDEVNERGPKLLLALAVMLIFNLTFFRAFKTYSNVLRLSSFMDGLSASMSARTDSMAVVWSGVSV